MDETEIQQIRQYIQLARSTALTMQHHIEVLNNEVPTLFTFLAEAESVLPYDVLDVSPNPEVKEKK